MAAKHPYAEKGEEAESDPVVDSLDIDERDGADLPADQRHHCLKRPEGERDGETASHTRPEPRTLGERDREGVHGKRGGEEEGGKHGL